MLLAGATEAELTAHKRKRCELPAIRAEELEQLVWSELIFRISFGLRGTPSNLETIIDPKSYDAQINELKTQVAYLVADLKRLTTKREHLFPLLGKSDFYADEFTSRLRDTDQEIQSITAKQSEIKAMIEDLAGQQSNLQELRDFIANNREWLQQIKMELDHLSPDDKKRVIECLVNGRIPITTNPEDGSWDLGLLRIRFNSNIFRALADERKISLDSNGSNPSTGP